LTKKGRCSFSSTTTTTVAKLPVLKTEHSLFEAFAAAVAMWLLLALATRRSCYLKLLSCGNKKLPLKRIHKNAPDEL
jgi:hypothetical protein